MLFLDSVDFGRLGVAGKLVEERVDFDFLEGQSMEQHWKGQKIVEEHSFELEEKTEVEEEQMMPMDPWDDALVEKKVDTLLLFPQDNKDID